LNHFLKDFPTNIEFNDVSHTQRTQ
jgi:hypothetical protein